MNIRKFQLFRCENQGYGVLTQTHMLLPRLNMFKLSSQSRTVSSVGCSEWFWFSFNLFDPVCSFKNFFLSSILWWSFHFHVGARKTQQNSVTATAVLRMGANCWTFVVRHPSKSWSWSVSSLWLHSLSIPESVGPTWPIFCWDPQSHHTVA